MKKQYFQPEVEYIKMSGRGALMYSISNPGPDGREQPGGDWPF